MCVLFILGTDTHFYSLFLRKLAKKDNSNKITFILAFFVVVIINDWISVLLFSVLFVGEFVEVREILW